MGLATILLIQIHIKSAPEKQPNSFTAFRTCDMPDRDEANGNGQNYITKNFVIYVSLSIFRIVKDVTIN